MTTTDLSYTKGEFENKTYVRLDSEPGQNKNPSKININWQLNFMWTFMSWVLNLPRPELCIENLRFLFQKENFPSNFLK